MKIRWFLFFMGCLNFINGYLYKTYVYAQEVSDEKVKKEVINFEDELIQGKDAKPDLFFLFQQKKFNYKKLIKLRENFIPEIKNDAENIKAKKGAH